MPYKLMAARFEDFDYADKTVDEVFDDIVNPGIRWSLPGGVQRFEFTIKASSKQDAYERYRGHLGQNVILFDSFIDKFISGNTYEILKDGIYNTYIAGGPWRRLNDSLYDRTKRPSTTQYTNQLVADILTDGVSIVSSDQSNVDATNVNGDGWLAATVGGSAAYIKSGDAIVELAEIGDSQDNPVDFYLVNPRFNFLQLDKPIPYLKSRSTTATADWQFNINQDAIMSGSEIGRNIWNLATALRVVYNSHSGVADDPSGANGYELVDAAGNFIASNVAPGDTAYNLTTQVQYTVESVDSATQLTMTEQTGTNFATDALYSIRTKIPRNTGSASPDVNYWDVSGMFDYPALDSAAALQVRDKLAAIYSKAVKQHSFILGGRRILNGNNVEEPIWRPMMGSSFYFRINDLAPHADLFAYSDDRLQTFMAIAMDYNQGRLRIVPSTNDSRLDAILAKAGLLSGEVIDTEAFIRERTRIAASLPPAAAGSGRGHPDDRHIPDPGGRGRGRNREGDIAFDDWEAEQERLRIEEEQYWLPYL